MAALAHEFISLGIQVRIRSTRPDYLFSEIDSPFCSKDDIRNDVGVVHQQGLVTDLAATRDTLLRLMSSRSTIVEREVIWLRKESINLVVADIPFLIIDACTYAGIPVYCVSNFDWSFIYERLFHADYRLRPLLNNIRSLYQRCDAAFRLPFSSRLSMSAFPSPQKMGLLARQKDSYTDIREIYSIDSDKKILACTFGGEPGMSINMKAICSAFPGLVLSSNPEMNAGNHIYVPRDADWLDVIHGADLLLTKPGYSTFAEATQFNLPILYCPRRDYPEEEVLIRGLRSYLPKYEITTKVSGPREWKQIFSKVPEATAKNTAFRNQNPQIARGILARFFTDLSRNSQLKSVLDIGSNNLNYLLWNSSTRQIIHTAHFTTRLGSGIDQSSIKRFKRDTVRIMSLDVLIPSRKNAIAASIARDNPSFQPIADWLHKSYGINTKIISQKLEAGFSYRACVASLPLEREPIVVDIGGLSTELIWGEAANQWSGIKLGLLSLSRELATTDVDNLANRFPEIPDVHGKQLVLVGLTGSFLAAIVMRQARSLPWSFHNTRIRSEQLRRLAGAVKNGEKELWEPYLQSGSDEPILIASLTLVSILLDKYQASDILVCYHGISFGFALRSKTS